MRFGSVCSGIEAASVAWHPLGWEAAWLSEIEPFPCAVLKHHYPDVPNYGDMTLLPDRILSGEVEAPDLFCGGTPCQAFSVAGLRNSLDDARGNLSLTFVGIANAIDHVRSVRRIAPAIIFWENVPGVLNTKDNAFGCFLGALAGETEPIVPPGDKWTNSGCVFGPQRTVAWRVLDAQYFGVAQRRRRVFVVASAREDFDPTEVLFESEGVRRDTAPSREAREEVAGTIAARFGISRNNIEECVPVVGSSPDGKDTIGTLMARDYKGIGNQDLEDGRGLVLEPIAFTTEQTPKFNSDQALTLTKQSPTGGGQPQCVAQPFQQIADCLTSAYGTKWNGNASATNGSLFVSQPIAFEPGKMKRLGYGVDGSGIAPVLRAEAGDNQLAVAYNIAPGKGELKDDIHVTDAHISKTLDASGSNPAMHQGGAAIVQPIPFDTTQITSKSNYSKPKAGDPCHPLAAGAHPPAIAQPVGTDLYNCTITGDIACTFTADATSATHSGPTVMVAPTLTASNDPSRSPQSTEVTNQVAAVYSVSMAVRRLTPVECERLQGFPDGYTNIPWRKASEAPDGPRYKALGNSWAVPVVRWIGKRIQERITK